eukprot:CAMPEP_0119116834 /NCGR_PEP_ID=MMETSP1180-20130426/52505_1 /TAXON_ID=3052 ORGANISM="Chlamydomonas cf sp, Strain CCMP681" /NCGR_SAMPLE_ID=MMETSP1180 /ASSEMBLY_ACC=CAM_ASM_000741 /LENGTH=92 /DNA_ID=CAMNT_0007106027 /DNA_START=900 /DNA_END=1174 /DNA_ORIENTATION=-
MSSLRALLRSRVAGRVRVAWQMGETMPTTTSSTTGCAGGLHTRGVTSARERGTGSWARGMVAKYLQTRGSSCSLLTVPVRASLKAAGFEKLT